MRSSVLGGLGFCLAIAATPAASASYGLGQPASPQEIAGWNIDIGPDGAGLPNGKGDVARGEALFAHTCAACHGAKGEGGLADRLVGGQGTLSDVKPVRTVGSYWPYATTVFDYIRRAMPYNAPQSLSPDDVYSVVAYLLWLNDIVPRAAIMDRFSLPHVQMPNRNGFIHTLGEPSAGRPGVHQHKAGPRH